MEPYEQRVKELDEAEEDEIRALLDASEALEDEDTLEVLDCRYGFSGNKCNWENRDFCSADGRRCDHCPE